MECPTSATTNTTTYYLYQDLDTDYAVANLRHRIGFKYKYTRHYTAYPHSWGFKVGIKTNVALDSNFDWIHRGEEISPQVTSWTANTWNTDAYVVNDDITNYYLYFYLNTAYSETAKTRGYIDEVYMEHVYNSVSSETIYGSTAANSGSSTETNIGYYEIDTWADLGSIRWREIGQDSEVILMDKSLEWYDPTGWGERNTKYEINAQFTNVSSDVFDKLEALKRIQKNGYSLNLHPYLDELPSVLTGKMYLEGIDYSHWDVGLVSFNFRFRES